MLKLPRFWVFRADSVAWSPINTTLPGPTSLAAATTSAWADGRLANFDGNAASNSPRESSDRLTRAAIGPDPNIRSYGTPPMASSCRSGTIRRGLVRSRNSTFADGTVVTMGEGATWVLSSASNGSRCSLPSGTTNTRFAVRHCAIGCTTASYNSFPAYDVDA